MTSARRRVVLALFAAAAVGLAALAPTFAEVAPPAPAPTVGLWGTGPGPGLGEAP